MPPCFSTLSRARALSWSRFQPALATPITGTFRWPRRAIPCSAGKIFLYARSPVAPKKTRASELDAFMIDSLSCGFFQMSTELETHRREQLVLIVRLAARTEALIERGGEHRHRHRLVDGGLDRPASFSGVGNPACKLLQVGIFHQCRGRQVEQPGCHDAAAAPYFSDVAQVEVILVVLGITEGSRFGIHLMAAPAHAGAAQNSQSFGVSCHESVLDAVVDHLDEVAGPVRAAVQVSLLGGAADLVTTGRTRDVVAPTWCERREDRVETLHHIRLAADHHAVAAFQSPDTAAGADIYIVNLLAGELPGATDVVYVIRVASVDKNVAGFEQRHKVCDALVYNRGRH